MIQRAFGEDINGFWRDTKSFEADTKGFWKDTKSFLGVTKGFLGPRNHKKTEKKFAVYLLCVLCATFVHTRTRHWAVQHT